MDGDGEEKLCWFSVMIGGRIGVEDDIFAGSLIFTVDEGWTASVDELIWQPTTKLAKMEKTPQMEIIDFNNFNQMLPLTR